MEPLEILLPTLRVPGAEFELRQDRGAENDVLGRQFPELL